MKRRGAVKLQTGEFVSENLTPDELCLLLLSNLASVNKIALNIELLQQIKNSIKNSGTFKNKRNIFQPTAMITQNNAQSLIKAEQSLLWGHPFHPAPKSRSGVLQDALLDCSPEMRTIVQPFWFRIRTSLIETMTFAEPSFVLNQQSEKDFSYYSCHPWESDLIISQPVFQKAVQEGDIEIVGNSGEAFYPTSSVRTLYQASKNQFVKYSIHVRLTNCIRKNSIYELKTAVVLTELLKALRESTSSDIQRLELMTEECATSVDFFLRVHLR